MVRSLAGKADICHAALLQATEDRREGAGGERNGRGEWTGPLFFRISADQVKRSEAVDCEPSDGTFADSMGNIVEAGGAPGNGAPKGKVNGRYRHGQITAGTVEEGDVPPTILGRRVV
jgi:hypothetical protein